MLELRSPVFYAGDFYILPFVEFSLTKTSVFETNRPGSRKGTGKTEFSQMEEKEMTEQAVRNANVMERSKVRIVAQIGMLGALAAVLMSYLKFPLPFLAPGFYEMDFSEIPVLLGSFTMGPLAGILIELIKNLVHLLIQGTKTAGVGDVANFLMGCAYVVPAGIIYRFGGKKTRAHAVIGMAAGIVCTVLAACFLNAFVLLPAYGKAFEMPVEAFVEMGAAIHPSVNSLFRFAVLIVAPFNLFKFTIISLIVLLIYKRIRVILRTI